MGHIYIIVMFKLETQGSAFYGQNPHTGNCPLRGHLPASAGGSQQEREHRAGGLHREFGRGPGAGSAARGGL